MWSILFCDLIPGFLLQSFLNMQLYEKALDLFEDEPSTSVSFSAPLPSSFSSCT